VSAGRLDREAWIAAGLSALEEGGVPAVSAAAIAKALGVTRGSFYWHFSSREELLQAVLERWERDHSDAVLDNLERIGDPHERLRLLIAAATSSAPSPPSQPCWSVHVRDASPSSPRRTARRALLRPQRAGERSLPTRCTSAWLSSSMPSPTCSQVASAMRSRASWAACSQGSDSMRVAALDNR
jgi:AcrR family transcriptional regulator